MNSNRNLKYLEALFGKLGVDTKSLGAEHLLSFAEQNEVEEAIDNVFLNQEMVMKQWQIKSKILEFINNSFSVPNGHENLSYIHVLDNNSLDGIQTIELQGLEDFGLLFEKTTLTISGTPNKSGDFKVKILFKVMGESEVSKPHEKTISLIINADPKSLWSDIPSNKDALFWKEDNHSDSAQIGEHRIIVSSKRGRSHQNVGSFRDDDFAFKHFAKTGWTVVAVSDGAGGSELSRRGSKIACEEIINYFENVLSLKELASFEERLNEFVKTKDESMIANLQNQAKKSLYKAALHVHTKLEEESKTISSIGFVSNNRKKVKHDIEYFHSTLIFTAYKKTKMGYIFLSFGVGDCPIGVVSLNQKSVKLLNTLDVGEFGGGTRFITQRNIFGPKASIPIESRFTFDVISDFSHLFLMTDGIYDPKFVVEANLEKFDNWKLFIEDLEGNNEDNAQVDFNAELKQTEEQLSSWMDFWSKGNHDDRTLAIIYKDKK
jgi:serine/threonine protein phosphatase PrpC